MGTTTISSTVYIYYIVAILLYFLLLRIVGKFTEGKGSNVEYFTSGKNAPWILVAIGMVGTSISGVTFISVPGQVYYDSFTYLQIVLGYLLGYLVIALVLLPLYYKLNLVSIYSFLHQRFGIYTYKTGAFFFLISRLLGSALRLFLAVKILQIFIFDSIGLSPLISTLITITAIMLYSSKGGIKTIIYTDVLQTIVFLSALVLTIFYIGNEMNLSFFETLQSSYSSGYSKIFDFDYNSPKFFVKHVLAGMFITIAMTGLDQEMMQKNISIKTLKSAQKNVGLFSVVLVISNILFVGLGAMIYLYSEHIGMNLSTFSSGRVDTDSTYPSLVFQFFPLSMQLVFIIGLVAAACSGADAALTALTTSVCIDFFGFDRKTLELSSQLKIRKIVHISFAALSYLIIIAFFYVNSDSVINTLFKIAGYTYGPLLGLFAYGIISKRSCIDKKVALFSLISIPLTIILVEIISNLLPSYKFGFEVLPINGGLSYMLISFLSKKNL